MTHFEIILSALSLSFVWMYAFNIPARVMILDFKPFNCMMCLTGWISGGLALANNYSVTALLFAAVGVFAGAMFEAIKMRCL